MSVNIAVWDSMQDILGFDLVALLITGKEKTGEARAKLFEYDINPQKAPDEIIKRFYFIAKIVCLLDGSFNDFGIRRWFLRERVQLKRLSPAQIMKGEWNPDDEGPQKVLKLAEETYWGQSAT